MGYSPLVARARRGLGAIDVMVGASAFFIMALAPGLTCQGCYNLTGANREAAKANAAEFAAELGLELKGVSCVEHDTDGDGYVSCTFSLTSGDVQTFECAGRNIIQDNHGCRAPKLKLTPGARAIQP
jgi:hypothetical protein